MIIVRGVDALRAVLERARKAARDLPEARRAVAQDIVDRARPPRRTGALARSIRVITRGDQIAAGTTIRYGWPVHSGTDHMPARPFLTDAVDEDAAEAVFGRVLDRTIGD